MSDLPFQSYVPAGPTIAEFHCANDLVRMIAGPVGGGKTGGSLMECLYRARAQEPHPSDGVRRTKWAVIRDSYRELEKTTIPSWLDWVPKTVGHFVGGSGGLPTTHTMGWALPDGSQVQTRIEFIGLGEHAAKDVMPGWEGTGAYLNEADKLTRDTLLYVKERVGRYPKVDAGRGFKGATWKGVWGDFNKPDTEHWLYQDFVETPVEGYRLFDQPGAMVEVDGRFVLNPNAENLANLVAGYYEQQIVGAERWRVLRRVCNRWTASRDGQAVYEDWNDEVHVARGPIAPVRGIPLGLGMDAGLSPAAVIGQRLPDGSRRVLAELACGQGVGAARFARELKGLLFDHFRPWLEAKTITGWADPSAAAGVDREEGEASWLMVVNAELGLLILPAPTNKPLARWEAVRRPLRRSNGFQIDPRCKVLRKGFNGGYRFRKKNIIGHELFADQAEKNEFSHVHDALQYWCSGDGEDLAMRRPEPVPGRPERTAPRRDWDYDPYSAAAMGAGAPAEW